MMKHHTTASAVDGLFKPRHRAPTCQIPFSDSYSALSHNIAQSNTNAHIKAECKAHHWINKAPHFSQILPLWLQNVKQPFANLASLWARCSSSVSLSFQTKVSELLGCNQIPLSNRKSACLVTGLLEMPPDDTLLEQIKFSLNGDGIICRSVTSFEMYSGLMLFQMHKRVFIYCFNHIEHVFLL